MMEQTHAGKCHDHIVFIAAFDHLCITHGAARLCHVAYAAFLSLFNIVTKQEDSIAHKGHAFDLIQISSLFFK